MLDLLGRFGRNKEEQAMQRAYQRVFQTPMGQEVLADLLTRMHFFDETVNDEEVVLQNFARRMLHVMGIWQAANAPQIVEDFLRLPLRLDENKD